ncbi:hypothetical protein PVK06_033891 [Gossypium arboreum]|uniref:RNase H type-1 domain-containing protein n=1 Tax=Gossypium arboreum TaxID=29729 RepID=A0ABR0NCN6_GOSAR|nr:hypothetical protein PVK06_033891 [Gossypium arboreum]
MKKYEEDYGIRKKLFDSYYESFKDHKGWVCLNSYGSVRPEDAFATSGGLLRNQNGEWIIGFSRIRRGICIDPACGICDHEYEDVLHTLRDYTTIRDIWSHLILPDGLIRPEDTFATAGGLLKNQNREWIIDFNSLVAINMIKDGVHENSNFALVRIIHTILKLLSIWSLQHISREDHKLADKVVTVVRDRKIDLRLMEESTQMSFT